MIHAICHDQRNLLGGELRNVTERGGELVSASATSGPVFPLRAQVVLNLFKEETKQSVTFEARLCGAKRREGVWVYTLRWRSTPPI